MFKLKRIYEASEVVRWLPRFSGQDLAARRFQGESTDRPLDERNCAVGYAAKVVWA